MTIRPEVHSFLNAMQLRLLIEVCERCECTFNCYCASNKEWAEKQLAKLSTPANGNAP